jgi:ppGpp synthetase/RelA/SpoT-type nucleotidyltranferase
MATMDKEVYNSFLCSIFDCEISRSAMNIKELKKQINQVGENFKTTNLLSDDDAKTLSAWRAVFSPIINSLATTLQKISIQYKKHAIRPVVVSTRLKRTPSIILKLQRFPDMVLSRMQDIGGVRTVYQKMEQVMTVDKRLKEIYGENTNNSFELIRERNYIKSPKEDGYRSIHHIYKYKGKFKELHGLIIELQIRTAVQHIWATAVEIFDLKQKSSIKIGGGDELHKRFFILVGSLFSKFEGDNRKISREQLEESYLEIEEIDRINKQCHILPIFKGIVETSQGINDENVYGYILELDIDENQLEVHPFSQKDDALYNKKYAEIEQKNKNENLNREVVLVYSNDLVALKDAYPNYYMDASKFIGFLDRVSEIKNAVKSIQ